MDNGRFTPLAAPVFLVAMVLLSGCSSEQKVEYDYPKALCGVPVDRDLIEPFFLPGSKLSRSGSGLDNSLVFSWCSYQVDGAGQIKVEFNRRIDSDTLREIVNSDKATFDSSGKFALLSDGDALGVEKCSHSLSDDRKPRSYTVEITVPDPEKIDGVRTKLAALMKALLPAAVKADGC